MSETCTGRRPRCNPRGAVGAGGDRMKARTCLTCQYRHTPGIGVPTCRRYPPHPVHRYPRVFNDDWCGEHKGKPGRPAKEEAGSASE